jgi:flagellar motor switch protein FliN/FliY
MAGQCLTASGKFSEGRSIMPRKKAIKVEEPVVEDEAELDQAISELRDVLEESAAGETDSLMDSLGDGAANDEPTFPAGDFSMDDFPDTAPTPDVETPDTEASDFGTPDVGAPDMNGFEMNNMAMPGSTGASGTMANTDIIMDIPVEVQIVLGKTRMKVSSLMKLDEGATISLDRRIGESVDIMVNGRMIGHGEITVLEEDETRFGVKLTNILGGNKAPGGT